MVVVLDPMIGSTAALAKDVTEPLKIPRGRGEH
jgi:hypothetical protein